jgi:hypothetical protein
MSLITPQVDAAAIGWHALLAKNAERLVGAVALPQPKLPQDRFQRSAISHPVRFSALPDNVIVALRNYQTRQTSYVAVPPQALVTASDNQEILEALASRINASQPSLYQQALNPNALVALPPETKLASPGQNWLQRSQVVGVNLRQVGGFLGLVKAAMTLPQWQDTIHVLPFFQTSTPDGTNHHAGLYAPFNWQVSWEFFDPAWQNLAPQLDTPAKQLKVAVNLLHAMGKKVLVDVPHHMGSAADTVFAMPELFEWFKITPQQTEPSSWPIVYGQQAEAAAKAAIASVVNQPVDELFKTPGDNDWIAEEERRLGLIFGTDHSRQQNVVQQRDLMRGQLHQALKQAGVYITPKLIHPPFHPVGVAALNEAGWPIQYWTKYESDKIMLNPEEVFATLAPFKFFELDETGLPNTQHPHQATWDYLTQRWQGVFKEFGLDGIRADMGHVNYRGEQHLPSQGLSSDATEPYYDLFQHLLVHLNQRQPGADLPVNTPVALFTESSRLPEKGELTGSNHETHLAHLARQRAHVLMDSIQYKDFDNAQGLVQEIQDQFAFESEAQRLTGRRIATSRTIFTADSDTVPRAPLYANPLHNQARWFLATMMPPSYVHLGFETEGRERAEDPTDPDRESNAFAHRLVNVATKMPGQSAPLHTFVWGPKNETYEGLARLRSFLDKSDTQDLRACLQQGEVSLITTDSGHRILSWVVSRPNQPTTPAYLFVLNPSAQSAFTEYHVSLNPDRLVEKALQGVSFTLMHSTNTDTDVHKVRVSEENTLVFANLKPGEGRVYQLVATEAPAVAPAFSGGTKRLKALWA